MKRVLYLLDVAVFLVVAAFVFSSVVWNARTLAGLALTLAGFALWMTARVQLGRSFAVRAHARQLVTHGLYAKFRSPIYMFSIVAYVGVIVASGKWWWLVVVPVIWIFQSRRIRKEEAVLEEAFGEEYRKYRAGTWI